MDITVTLSPAGNTTRRELAALASESAQALRGLRDVAGVAPVRGVAPDGAKGMAEELGAFVLSLQPAAITGAFGVLRAVLARAPDTPTKVKITAAGGIELEFDPRRTTTEQMAELVTRLRAAPPPA